MVAAGGVGLRVSRCWAAALLWLTCSFLFAVVFEALLMKLPPPAWPSLTARSTASTGDNAQCLWYCATDRIDNAT
jgi:hypothetical protein